MLRNNRQITWNTHKSMLKIKISFLSTIIILSATDGQDLWRQSFNSNKIPCDYILAARFLGFQPRRPFSSSLSNVFNNDKCFSHFQSEPAQIIVDNQRRHCERQWNLFSRSRHFFTHKWKSTKGMKKRRINAFNDDCSYYINNFYVFRSSSNSCEIKRMLRSRKNGKD